MNSLLKSAILVATIAGASATNLRVDNYAAMESTKSKLTNFENAFIEKGAAKYDCTGTTVAQVEQFAATKQAEKVAETDRCAKNHARIAKAVVDETAIWNGKEAKAITGDYPSDDTCIAATCATPKSEARDARAAIKMAHDAIVATAASDAKASLELVTDAAQELKEAEATAAAAAAKAARVKKETTAEKARLTGVFNADILTLKSQLTAETAKLNKYAKEQIAAATTVSEGVVDECHRVFKEHTALINKDTSTLSEIKTELAKLKLCPTAGTANVFLEVDAAARLEAHCALTRQTIQSKAPGDLIGTDGDVTKWDARIVSEQNAATATRDSCTSAAAGVLQKATNEANANAAKAIKTFTETIHNVAVADKTRDLATDKKAQTDLLNAADKELVDANGLEDVARVAHAGQVKQNNIDKAAAAAAKVVRDKKLEGDNLAVAQAYSTAVANQGIKLKKMKADMVANYGTEAEESKQVCAGVLGEIASEQKTLLIILHKITNMQIIGNYAGKLANHPDLASMQ